jgi:hypothetical protein
MRGLILRRSIGLFMPDGMRACSRWLSEATPPDNALDEMHPEGMPADFSVFNWYF